MNIHEYQGKNLFRTYGIPVAEGCLATSVEEAVEKAASLSGPMRVVKAQVHAGGRGKGGGVKICRTLEEVREASSSILGMTLVTRQTGDKGKKVRKIWIENGTAIEKELYLAVVLDRSAGLLSVMISPDGGTDIEATAEKKTERFFTSRLGCNHEIWDFQARNLFMKCGLSAGLVREGMILLKNLVRLAVEKDAVLVEINPLAVSKEGRLIALDAKINFDDSALVRHPDIAALDDPDESDELELKARKAGVNYVHLNGYVGTMVNGAGLAMATMDAIKLAGGEPANFLDAGGGANADAVARGFTVMLSDARVRGVLVNIFGGILRCDIVAQGIIEAVRKVKLNLPIVIRLEGTNADEGRRVLRESGLRFITAETMADAAEKIVALTRRSDNEHSC